MVYFKRVHPLYYIPLTAFLLPLFSNSIGQVSLYYIYISIYMYYICVYTYKIHICIYTHIKYTYIMKYFHMYIFTYMHMKCTLIFFTPKYPLFPPSLISTPRKVHSFSFWKYLGLNSGHLPSKHESLPLEPCLQPFMLWLFWR
jgi:hypothetical protein